MIRLVAAATLAFAGTGTAQQVVILVRHAEKATGPDAGQDPPLSPAGEERAKALAAHLKDAGVDVVYTSKYRRTKMTALPLLAATRKPHHDLDGDVAAKLREQHKDQVVLIVAHSGVQMGVQTYIDQITGRRNGITLGEHDYDQMFILVRKKGDSWSVIRTRYGK